MAVKWRSVERNLDQGAICEDEREIGGTLLTCHRIRIGCVPVKAGIVGHVHTVEDRRGQGIGRRVMEGAHRRMAAKGCQIAFLFGIPRFYLKLGYAVVQNYYATMWDFGRHRVELPARHRCRRYRPGDLGAVMKIYRTSNRFRTGSFVRGRSDWLSDKRVGKYLSESLCAVGPRGGVRGYAKLGDRRDPAGRTPFFHARYMAPEGLDGVLVVPEAGALDEGAAAALLAGLRAEASKTSRSRVLFLGPPDHELSRAMYGVGAQHRQAVVPDGGAQARILDLGGLFKLLGKEFTRRCRESAFGDADGRLSISTDVGCVSLRVRRGEVAVAPARRGALEIPAQKLIQHLFGFCDPPALPGRAGALARGLFPRQFSHSWPLDEMI